MILDCKSCRGSIHILDSPKLFKDFKPCRWIEECIHLFGYDVRIFANRSCEKVRTLKKWQTNFAKSKSSERLVRDSFYEVQKRRLVCQERSEEHTSELQP